MDLRALLAAQQDDHVVAVVDDGLSLMAEDGLTTLGFVDFEHERVNYVDRPDARQQVGEHEHEHGGEA